MPIDVRWDNGEHTIVRLDFVSPVSWETFQAAIDEAARLVFSVKHRVDVLSIPGDVPMPPGSPAPQVMRAFKKLPPNVGLVIMVTSNDYSNTIVSAVGGVYMGKRYRAADSVEAAYRIIAEHRAKANSPY
jgi:hypothetical protein